MWSREAQSHILIGIVLPRAGGVGGGKFSRLRSPAAEDAEGYTAKGYLMVSSLVPEGAAIRDSNPQSHFRYVSPAGNARAEIRWYPACVRRDIKPPYPLHWPSAAHCLSSRVVATIGDELEAASDDHVCHSRKVVPASVAGRSAPASVKKTLRLLPAARPGTSAELRASFLTDAERAPETCAPRVQTQRAYDRGGQKTMLSAPFRLALASLCGEMERGTGDPNPGH